jgi:hypothetical protein
VILRFCRMSPGGQYVLQKNLLTANGSMATQQVLERENGRLVPPLYSPDLDTLCFSIAKDFKGKVQARPHLNMAALRTSIAKGGRSIADENPR